MKCPQCNGEYDRIDLLSVTGDTVPAQRCTQCGGVWFQKPLKQQLNLQSVWQNDPPSPNYSLKSSDLTCSLDGTLMSVADHDISPHSGQYWECPDCDGMFFPRGQLALYEQWLNSKQSPTATKTAGFSRAQVASGVFAIFMLSAAVLAAVSKGDLSLNAAQTQALPNSGPNVLTLLMLAVTYIAGTILAVLGRRLPIIFMGWGVIVICLFGFSIIIFGP